LADTFTIKDGEFCLNGEPFKIYSGAMHYFRTLPEYWEDRLLKLKLAGFNTVETYVCWNLHEPKKGEYNFSGIVQKENHGNTLAVPVSGYIRTAFLQKPLHQYLNESEQYRSAAIYDLKRTTVIADGVQGYQWKYKIKKDDGKFIIVNDAFFSGNNKFYTLHFSAVADNKNSAENTLIQGALDAVYEETLNSIIFEGSVQSGKLLEWYS
jgi:hypothetical protein